MKGAQCISLVFLGRIKAEHKAKCVNCIRAQETRLQGCKLYLSLWIIPRQINKPTSYCNILILRNSEVNSTKIGGWVGLTFN